MGLAVARWLAVSVAAVSVLTESPPSLAIEESPASPTQKTEAAVARNSDLDAPPRTANRLAPFVTFGGKLKLEYELDKNFDLDDARGDGRSTIEPKLSVAVSVDPNSTFQAFLNLELFRKFALEEEGKKRARRTELELKEAFIAFKELGDGLSFRVGRQRFVDDRQWLYDEELDAARAFYRVARLSLQASASRKDLVDRDLLNGESRERINNYLLYGRYALGTGIDIAGYGLVRDDRSAAREDLAFIGLHSSGEIVDNLDHWLELAYARGREGSKRTRGIGADAGATYGFDTLLRPSVTIAYAFGDGGFRQTGLQDNSGRFKGVVNFKYYGELLDPELSNLSIFTGGVGVRPTRRSSIDLVYHYYLQDDASTRIRDSEITARPAGRSKRLGSEADLILGYRELRNVTAKLALAYFIPGNAFPAGTDSGFLANIELQISF